MLNAMTVDLEDWGQAVLHPGHKITSRVAANLDRVLTLLDRVGVRATFFVLGSVCEAFPRLLPTIRDAGHEIGSHGYGHELVYRMTPARFAADVRRSIQVIEAQIGQRPAAYRAPAFSITRDSLWAVPILAGLGFRYSSSVFPIAGRRYGIADAPRFPYRWPNCELIEFPPATVHLLGRNWPVCGGGYTRLLPAGIMTRALRRINRAGHPAVIYFHPYELAPGEVAAFRREGSRISWRRQLTQELWRSRVADRLARLCDEFAFGTLGEALASIAPALKEQSAGLDSQQDDDTLVWAAS
ncbi:MAG TPA: DUF3473 domain-containing protein [Phycisphaerae bacterium]|jgi:polysaccharide deacetylase family protein (PEP-CTERM system associated)|nr:DUF3473 domain-containing protein [Phycisphaerae bacterium]HOB73937.1 DUF3473 domain-containing protein [Phycisphaerae bacterium]HOJ56265.1 DUF3473 domain-containing protein [Phycisphaerae bacterium]HOL28143.1 DUF3473 domain-containing protein [Phycisphaerae bacterium]HPP19746.1 DUF3473 domain-containing protein [Phycisphaerae bacterium]